MSFNIEIEQFSALSLYKSWNTNAMIFLFNDYQQYIVKSQIYCQKLSFDSCFQKNWIMEKKNLILDYSQLWR